ncbi:hypothetical protein FRC11_011930, partial [Ceratobasidium sp. 423]
MRSRCGRICYDANSRIVELKASGNRIYLILVNNRGAFSVACYTENMGTAQAYTEFPSAEISPGCITSLEEMLEVGATKNTPTGTATHTSMVRKIGSWTSYRAWELGLLFAVFVAALSLHYLRGSMRMYLELDFIGNIEVLACVVDSIQDRIPECLLTWFNHTLALACQ